jgi:hypothetical protein
MKGRSGRPSMHRMLQPQQRAHHRHKHHCEQRQYIANDAAVITHG